VHTCDAGKCSRLSGESSRRVLLAPCAGPVPVPSDIIKFGSEINAVAFHAVNFASPIIDFGLETIYSAPDTVNAGFNMINFELETMISGIHMTIVKASMTKCVLVATFSMT